MKTPMHPNSAAREGQAVDAELEKLLAPVKAAESRMEAAEQELSAASKEHSASLRELAWWVHGVRIGSVVSCKRGVFRVSIVKPSWNAPERFRPWLEGFKQKKDGTFAERETFIGSEYDIITA
jgi:hypothetical protein